MNQTIESLNNPDVRAGLLPQVQNVVNQSLNPILNDINAIEDNINNHTNEIENIKNQIKRVQDFGAVGDGITDDTIAINNALASSQKVDFGVNKTYLYNGLPPFNGHIIESANCEIKVPAGVFNYTTSRLISGLLGNGLAFSFPEGTTYTASSCSFIGTAKAFELTLNNIANASALNIGDFILIRSSTHTSDVVGQSLTKESKSTQWIRGVWKIINKTTDSITVLNTYHNATPPAINDITGITFKKINTVINFTGCDGFRINSGSYLNMKSGAVVLAGDYNVGNATGTVGTHGVVINAPLIVNNASSNTTVLGGGAFGSNADFCLYGWGEQGIAFEGSTAVSSNFIISCANRKRGLYASGSSSGRCKYSITHGNGDDGVITDEGSNLACSLGSSCGNGLNGYWSTSNSFLNCANTVAVGNLTNGYEARGASRILADSSMSAFNTLQGYSATDGGMIDADYSLANNNLQNGFYFMNGGTIDANNASATNNQQYGVSGELGNFNFAGGGAFTGNILGAFNAEMQGAIGYNNSSKYPLIHQEFKTTSGGLIKSVGSAGNVTTMSTSSIGDYSVATSSGRGFTMKSGGAFRPIGDNNTSLGDASNRFTTVFSATGTINTSDENKKRDIRKLNEKEKQVARILKKRVKAFKFIESVKEKGECARTHIGFIAQEVFNVFQQNGLNAEDYGIFCKDLDENDGKTYIYGLRYEQLLCFIL